MDGDPAVEPELDTFSLFLPLPYRVAIVLVLGTSLAEGLKVRSDFRQASGRGRSTYIIFPFSRS